MLNRLQRRPIWLVGLNLKLLFGIGMSQRDLPWRGDTSEDL